MSKRTSGFDSGWACSINGYASGSQGKLFFGPGGDNNNARGNKQVSLNEWHMITFVYNFSLSQLGIYVDGVLDNVTDNIYTPNAYIDEKLYIGRDNPDIDTAYPLRGSLDDISIYNSGLSESSVANLYSATASKISPNLIAYWPFNNSADDLSGNWNNGKAFNLYSTADRFDNPTGAYRFDGINTYIEVPDKPDLRLANTDFTINSWVKIDDYNSHLGSLLFSKNSGPGHGWLWGIIGKSGTHQFIKGGMVYSLGSNATYLPGKRVIATNQWHMVTAVYEKAQRQLRIYIDGVLDKTHNNVNSPNAETTANLYIGRNDPQLSGNNFQGSMDDVSMYNSALSLSNIQQLYTAAH
ncbi:LamG domain-containing protein [Mucilaginibacter hurinus]|uniref:LamG domain-containing protein n=1 Tax=Mucilaginibacter hurinus TaxID=2201324 RepID=UPI0011BDDB31|nr:LamG-like jellyroll fold domain-containing protein [Mucilaginibacter hurinus]